MTQPKENGVTSWISSENKTRTILALFCWTLVILFLLALNTYRLNKFTEYIAINQARSQFQKDRAFRAWGASHGGVYVPTSKDTPPNPHLSHLPFRDITKPDGTKLTLMSPAYMVRQLNEQYHALYGIAGHLTSLNPLRPENKADSWEQHALQLFEEGVEEQLEFTEMNGEPYLRLMQPMVTQKSCLKCHAKQGYKEGDIRGGVAIAQPLTEVYAYRHNIANSQRILLILIWLMGVAFIVIQSRRLDQSRKRMGSALKTLQQERDIFLQGSVITLTWKNGDKRFIDHISANVKRVLGYNPDQLIDGTTPYTTIIHPKDVQRVNDEIIIATTERQKSFTHEPYRLVSPDGKTIWVQDNTTIIYDDEKQACQLQGYLVDISETMRVTNELQDHKDRLQLIIAGANLGTWEWNIQTGHVSFNERWAQIIGYELHEINPHYSTWEDLLHPEDKNKVLETLSCHLAGKSSFFMIEHRLKHKSGEWIWVFGAGRVFKWDDDGNPLLAVGIEMEITERKQVEHKLAQAKETAETANHAKSVFLSNMSHELRTPLNAILGYTQLFLGDPSLSETQQQGIRTIHQSGEHLLMLINDILDLSKIEAGKIELTNTAVNLPQFLRDIVEIIKIRSQSKGLEFRYEPAPDLPDVIEADELRLRQIILNLLSNAVKFTDYGWCALKVETQSVAENTIQLCICIEDSGVGIQEDMQERVFQPFQQTGERLKYAEGSGLGLAISKELIHEMQGRLELASPIHMLPPKGEGPGCRFSFSITVATPARQTEIIGKARRIAGCTSRDTQASPKKILIIDDDRPSRNVLRDNLKPLGFITMETDDNCDIVELCQQFKPDMILMELHMPKLSGYKAVELLTPHPGLADIPIIIITASTREKHKDPAYAQKHGFNTLITKPFSVNELIHIIAKQLHLELLYVEDEDSPKDHKAMVLPPKAILENLKTMAQAGDIMALNTAIAELTSMEAGQYQTFAAQLNQLAENFQLIEIEKLITRSEEE